MGESIVEGTITKWLKKPGDKVQRDEPLFEISTDKVDAEIPAPASGVLQEIKVTEGTTVGVNTVVGTIAVDGESAGARNKPAAPPAAEKPAPEKKEEKHVTAPPPTAAPTPAADEDDDRMRPVHPPWSAKSPASMESSFPRSPAPASAVVSRSKTSCRSSKDSPPRNQPPPLPPRPLSPPRRPRPHVLLHPLLTPATSSP